MEVARAPYDASTLRAAVHALHSAIGDADATGEAVTSAHLAIIEFGHSAPAVVAQWISDYLESLSHASSCEDVVGAVNRLAEHFKLPSRRRATGLWEQGRLFE
ncbi:hypothetical protein [Ilumatobacter sp.]|uniref:hypothetical protein n=1 Tax=Ilumatobacter sp. TaxID=1967498 RepID=UPI003B5175B2